MSMCCFAYIIWGFVGCIDIKLWVVFIVFFQNFVFLHTVNYQEIQITMATYTITVNERSASGKALMNYLQALGVLIEKISPKTKSSYLRSQEDKLAGRVETFSSSEEMFQSLGI